MHKYVAKSDLEIMQVAPEVFGKSKVIGSNIWHILQALIRADICRHIVCKYIVLLYISALFYMCVSVIAKLLYL